MHAHRQRRQVREEALEDLASEMGKNVRLSGSGGRKPWQTQCWRPGGMHGSPAALWEGQEVSVGPTAKTGSHVKFSTVVGGDGQRNLGQPSSGDWGPHGELCCYFC